MLDDELKGDINGKVEGDDDAKIVDNMLGELETLMKQPSKPGRYEIRSI